MASGGRRPPSATPKPPKPGTAKARARQAAERKSRRSRTWSDSGAARPSAKPAAAAVDQSDFRYPGNRLGLPETGPGSAAPWGRRFVALIIDWLIAASIAALIMRRPLLTRDAEQAWLQLGVFFAMSAILVGLLGMTIGHRLCGVQVRRPDGGRLGLWRGAVRSALICLLIPAAVNDRDRRGLQDKAVDSIVVRSG